MGLNNSCNFWRCDPDLCANPKNIKPLVTIGESQARETPRPAIEITCLRNIPLFNGLTISECGELLACARQRQYSADELIFRESESAGRVWVLRSGRVKLIKTNSSGDEVILRIITAGEILDGLQHHAGEYHRWTAQSWGDSSAISWPSAAFQKFLDRYPVLSSNVAKTIADRLGSLEERFCELAVERVPVRLGLTLLRLAQQIGRIQAGVTVIDISRQEVAQLTGTTMFTASRILSAWENKGLLQSKRGSISILDRAGLAREVDAQQRLNAAAAVRSGSQMNCRRPAQSA